MTRVYLSEVGGERPYRVSYHPDGGGPPHYTEYYETMREAQGSIDPARWQQLNDQHHNDPGPDLLLWAKI